jgi:hypothetical protein
VRVDRGLPGGFRIPHDREIEQVPLCELLASLMRELYLSKDTLVAASKDLDRS